MPDPSPILTTLLEEDLDLAEGLIVHRLHQGDQDVENLSTGIKSHVFYKRLRRLRKRGLIERKANPPDADGRKSSYTITPQGAELAQKFSS